MDTALKASRGDPYLPQLGVFAQTDPIGYEDSPNLYAYVLNDPVNLVDPFGLSCGAGQTSGTGNTGEDCSPVPVIAPKTEFGGFLPGDGPSPPEPAIIVTDTRLRYNKYRTRKLSTCWIEFLTKFDPTYDWNKAIISPGWPLPGSDASTAPNTIYSAALFQNLESQRAIFFHELGHLPQWQSRQLTTLGYLGEVFGKMFDIDPRHGLVSSGLSRKEIHDSLSVEIAANAYRDRLLASYKGAHFPCH